MKKNIIRIILLIWIILGIIVTARVLYPVKHADIVSFYSQKYDIEKELIWAIIKTESGFDSDAKSNKGALGLMQIMPDTGSWIAERQDMEYKTNMLYEPKVNINFGTWYFRFLMDKYSNIDVALAAYNAGPGNVDEWLSDKKYSNDGITLDKIPFKETDKYTKKVTINKLIYHIIY